MTMQRPNPNQIAEIGQTHLSQRPATHTLGAPSASAGAPRSAITAAASTALGILTNNNLSGDQSIPPPTTLVASGSLGSSYRPISSLTPSFIQPSSPHALWGQSSTLSSVPLLSPSELTGASDGKGNSAYANSNESIQQALAVAQLKQRLQLQEHDQQAQSLLHPKKRQRTMMMESSVSDSLSRGFDSNTSFRTGGTSSALSAGELGLVAGGFNSSLLRGANNPMTAQGSAALGGLSNLLTPSVLDLPNGSNNFSQVQQMLRKQQLQELQQLQQIKQREDIKRISQLQSRDAVLQLMLQQQQQQSLPIDSGNASQAAQLKALQDQQQSNVLASKSAIDEAAVANHMRRNSQNNNNALGGGASQQNNILQQMKALANRQAQHQQLDQQVNDGMHPPPPMVSAVSSLDSIAIMSMLLPGNQQNQNQQQQQSATSNASRLLGADLSLGVGASGLGAGANLNSSLLSPMPFPQQSLGNLGNFGNLGNLGNLGMGGSTAALFGGLAGVPGANGMASLMGRAGANAMCAQVGGPGGMALHQSAADVIYEQRRLAAAAEVSNNVRDSSVGKPPDAFVDRDPDGRAHELPTLLVVPMDHMQLSSHQTLLRYQIEVFRAGEEDTSTHTRGRNKPVQLGQIGIRCRHCKVLPVSRRKRGSVYFPRAVEGFYQAAQNMNSTHLQTGECPLMGNALRREFANLIATRGVSTGAGRAYWAKQARKLGLRNTDDGIVFDKKEAGSENATENESGSNSNNDENKNSNSSVDNNKSDSDPPKIEVLA